MGLFSKKNKRDRALDDSGRFYSKDDDAAIGERARSKRASNAGAAGAAGRRSANDPMLPEKKRARRRLVGAIALALAAAVGLPMLLDSSPKPLAGDIAIDIPSKDKAPALPLPAAPAAASAEASASAAAPATAATAPARTDRTVTAAESIDKGEEIIAAPPAAKPEARKPEPKPHAVADVPKAEHKEPKPEHKDAAKPEHKDTRLAEKADKADKPVKPKLEDKPAKPHDDTARALAILEDKSAEAKHDAAPGQKSVLQVAAMSSAEKAAEVQAKLHAAGISSFTEKTPSGLIRVKVGPLSKDEADKMHAKLAKLGL
jgi:DedD protein